MAREATNFEVESIRISPAADAVFVRTRPDMVAPDRFTAYIELVRPPLSAEMEVQIHAGGVAQIVELRLRPKREPTVTTTALRSVALDRLLRDVLRQAGSPVGPILNHWSDPYRARNDKPGVARTNAPSAKSRVQQRADAMAVRAAEIHARAVAHGSRAPILAVATEMDRSHTQAWRYVRHARELGLLP